MTDKFDWDYSVAASTLQAIHMRSIRCRLKHSVKVCRDPADDMFLECDALAKADLLIAGDKDLLVLSQYRRTGGAALFTSGDCDHVRTSGNGVTAGDTSVRGRRPGLES